MQEFTDKYKAGDSPRESGPTQSPLHHVLISAPKERDRDRDKDIENESGRLHRSDSISSTNSLESNNTRGIASLAAPQIERRGSGSYNAPGNCSGELKSILRKNTVPSLPPSSRSTPPSTTPMESTSFPVSHTNSRGISPAALTSNPSVLCISPLASIPSCQSLSSIFSISPIPTVNSVGLSSQSKKISDLFSPEEILVEIGDSETPKSTTSVSEMDIYDKEQPSNFNQSTESMLSYDERGGGQKEEGTNNYLYIFNEEEKKSRLKLVAVALEILPVSLNQFAAMFVEENAPFNMKKYVYAVITFIAKNFAHACYCNARLRKIFILCLMRTQLYSF